MTIINSYFMAEKLKFRRTLTGKLCWCVPILLAAGASWLARDYVQIDSFNWWYIGMLPGYLTLLCCQVVRKDKRMKDQIVLTLPLEPALVWDAKILYCAGMLAVSNLVLGVFAFFAGIPAKLLFGAGQMIEISPIRILSACILLSICYLWQIPACLWAAVRVGFLPAFLVNLLCNTAGAVYLSLTDWWIFCPYAVPARLMCAVIRVLPNGLVAEEGSLTFSPELLEMQSVIPGMAVCVGVFLAAWGFTRKWYGKTAGSRK